MKSEHFYTQIIWEEKEFSSKCKKCAGVAENMRKNIDFSFPIVYDIIAKYGILRGENSAEYYF